MTDPLADPVGSPPDRAAPARRRLTPLPTLAGFVIVFLACGLWSLATPRFAGPDELAHVYRAASAAHGQLLGLDVSTATDPSLAVRVPATIGRAPGAACLAGRTRISAACEAPWRSGSGSVTVATYVGRYPPLYYVIVGLPSLVVHSPSVLYAMRLVSAAVTALFLAVAFVSAARLRRGWLAVAGLAVAVTPQVLYLGGVVNPSGVEVASATCFWVCGLGLVTGADPDRSRLTIWAAISACVFVQMRGWSPLLALLAGGALVAFAGWRPAYDALRSRAGVRAAGAALVVCVAFALIWLVATASLRALPGRQADFALRRLVGLFGQLDTSVPQWVYAVWAVIVVVLAIALACRRDRRALAVVGALAAVVAVLPALFAAADDVAPLAAGLPLLAAYAISRGMRPTRAVRVAVFTGFLAMAAARCAAFVQMLHRYRTGIAAPIWVRSAPWEPPLGWIALLVTFATVQLLFVVWLLRLQPRGRDLQGGVDPRVLQ